MDAVAEPFKVRGLDPPIKIWPRNGLTCRSCGLYVRVDSVNAVMRTLDLRITALLGGGFAGPAGGSLISAEGKYEPIQLNVQ